MRDEVKEEIWEVLVEECGAQESMRDEFMHHFPGCLEFRFQGRLGFGGKVYSAAHEPYLWVACYEEDRTKTGDLAIARANSMLWRIHREAERTELLFPRPGRFRSPIEVRKLLAHYKGEHQRMTGGQPYVDDPNPEFVEGMIHALEMVVNER